MQHITRLLIRARKATSKGYKHGIGWVDYDDMSKMYTAKPQLWDGKPGSVGENIIFPDWWRGDWATPDEAADALEKLFAGFDIPEENCVIFVDDLTFPED